MVDYAERTLRLRGVRYIDSRIGPNWVLNRVRLKKKNFKKNAKQDDGKQMFMKMKGIRENSEIHPESLIFKPPRTLTPDLEDLLFIARV